MKYKTKWVRTKSTKDVVTKTVSRALAIACCCLVVAVIWLMTQLQANSQEFKEYPIQGFDVSRHQGDIAWKKINKEHYQFVFIKATEGGDYQDPKFQDNWLAARERGLKVGAYHFFRNCKSGVEQAENYMQTVAKKNDSLPPVIDLEFQWSCPEVTAEQLQQRILTMARLLERHYGKKPIFYTTPNYYKAYIDGKMDDYPLWLQDFNNKPARFERRPWLFWQYSAHGKIAGIATAVDLNIFRGQQRDLEQLTQPISSQTAD